MTRRHRAASRGSQQITTRIARGALLALMAAPCNRLPCSSTRPNSSIWPTWPARPARSTRSEEFRTPWAAHDVRLHRTGLKRLRHPVVGELTLSFETTSLPADPLGPERRINPARMPG